jgi:hypothetical protein
MAFTAPSTFTAGQLITANDLNTQLRDNLIALKDPNSASYILNESSDYATTSNAFVNVDATAGKLSLSITLAVQADVFIFFTGSVESSAAARANFDIAMDGTRIGGDDGLLIVGMNTINLSMPVSLTFLKTAVPAGSHTFNLQWKTNTGTLTMYAGAGTANQRDIHPQFIVREMS